uniref:Fucolectin tachylectin-4 pentraxin-1 domain-containing protein n=1 Tax=Cyprinus carpio TaxID=7962 RepID=A0A8C2KJD4_CYPCA
MWEWTKTILRTSFMVLSQQIIDVDTLMDSRMATRVILVLTLFTGLCGANLKGNIALHARAVQSSLGHPQGNAKHAVDGNREADYGKGSCTHTTAEFNPWWRADLGNVYSISNVSITNRGDCCKERLRGAQIRIGNNLENNGNNNELVATVDSVFAGTKMFEFKPVKGRYVNIFLPGNDKVLTLCEVEVFAEADKPQYICVPRNLALGGKAVQSSTYSSLGAARNAIDGNRQSLFTLGSCSHTNGDRNPWWRVDLLGIYRVTRVSITNRGDCCEKRIEGIQIRIGNSLENNGNNNQLAATVGPIPPGVTKTFAFRPIKGRYVNLIVPGRNEYLTLCEVEVYAD